MFLKIPFDFRNFDFKILIFKGKNFERKNFDVPEIPQNLRIFAPKLLKLTKQTNRVSLIRLVAIGAN